jgi:hypothetical protein
MKTLADRFRRWYEYERDCTSKTLEMLASVPAEVTVSAKMVERRVKGIGTEQCAR